MATTVYSEIDDPLLINVKDDPEPNNAFQVSLDGGGQFKDYDSSQNDFLPADKSTPKNVAVVFVWDVD